MYLEELTIKNFRTIRDLTLNFNKGLNILLGENNTGKSAVIDALRLCLTYGDQRRDMYIRKTDFHIDKRNAESEIYPIEFHLQFCIEDPIEAGWFNDLLVINGEGTQVLQIHFKYTIEKRNRLEKIRWRVWGGENEGQQITPQLMDYIYSVYLGALRNASNSLKPTRGNRLGQLYANLVSDKDGNPIDEDKQNELASKLISAFSEDEEWVDLIELGKEKVNEHLSETSLGGKEQSVEIDFFPLDFKRIVDNLRMQLPIYDDEKIGGDLTKQKFFDIFQNGLGYNNLIYIATVLGDLINRRNVEPESYIALLVEEPEAHLHPQLQDILFNYLNKLDGNGIQLFVTSHSPTITAKADINTIMVLQNQNNTVYSLPLRNIDLSKNNKNYLSKFLDVTKSQLFFANGVMLVEGISEALLITEFSRLLGPEFDMEKKGVEIVNVNGIAFEHFAKLFNSDNEEKRLNIRSAILTDDDKKNGDISSRARKAKKLDGGMLKVELADITFEYELFITSERNREILYEIFKEMHPKAAERISKGESIEEYGHNFLKSVENNKAKSKLSHGLLMELISDAEKRKNFVVPNYISDAIKWVVNGDEHV